MTKKQKSIDKAKLEAIPNIGPAIAAKLRLLGYKKPFELTGADPYDMYKRLCLLTGKHHDPCLLDVFISAVSFCNGNSPEYWWKFTAERKAKLKEKTSIDEKT
jgi:hypothetical protein